MREDPTPTIEPSTEEPDPVAACTGGRPPRPTTQPLQGSSLAREIVRSFHLTGVEGAFAGSSWQSRGDGCSIGSHPSNDLVLDDPTVSRFHCEIRTDGREASIRDLGSRNGTKLDGLRVKEAFIRGGSLLTLGRTVLRFQFAAGSGRFPLSEQHSFGTLSGASVAMRATFAVLKRAAACDSTVLLEGETGTGKGLAAESIHRAGARRNGPFVVVDCSAIPGSLLESELFGHEKGAFTGAVARRVGAFEHAEGGTVLLDEIGEMPTDLQPVLLRAIENREVRRIGSPEPRHVNVRIIAATNRDLRSEVNMGRFRSDLYFRLAVVRVVLPPLRQRPEDLPLLVDHLLGSLEAPDAVRSKLLSSEFLEGLTRAAWPGNVRELKNHLQRCLVFEEPLALPEMASLRAASGIDPRVPFTEARRRALDTFERTYLTALLKLHQGRITRASRAVGLDRAYLYRMLDRHGLRGPAAAESSEESGS